MNIEGISASSFNTYDQCQWKWFLTYTLGIEDVSGGAALLGQVCHDVFETMSIASINKLPLSHESFDIEKQWSYWLEEYYKKDPITFETIKADKIKKIKKGLIDTIEGRYKKYSPINENTICAEQYFKLPMEEERFRLDDSYFTIKGFIDRIDKINDDTLEIIDYKTGSRSSFMSDDKKKKDALSLRGDIQPMLYYIAAQKLYPQYKNFIITFVYTTDGGPITTLVSEEDITETIDIIYNRYQEIKNNNSPSRNKTWRCKFCSFDESKTNLCNKIYNEVQEIGSDGLEFVTNKFKILKDKK